MALKVNLVARKIPAGEDKGETRIFGQINVGDVISFDELCKRVSALTSATRGDVEMALSGMLLVMERHLERGDTVRLGSVGTVRMTAGSRGVYDPQDVLAPIMKPARIQFKPGKALKKILDEVTYKRLQVKVDDCEKEHYP